MSSGGADSGIDRRDPEGIGSDADGVEDETIVVSDETVVVSDATIAVVRPDPAGSARADADADADSDPTADTTAERQRVSTAVRDAEGFGLDPRRRVPALPGRAPWERSPAPEPGLHQGLPVCYAPRSAHGMGIDHGPDEIERRIGAPPAPTPVLVREGREALPSLDRRERRLRAVTLIAYPLIALAALIGLTALAVLAFR